MKDFLDEIVLYFLLYDKILFLTVYKKNVLKVRFFKEKMSNVLINWIVLFFVA